MIGPLRTFQTRLLRWYDAHHRKLPWRAVGEDAHKSLDPYHVLVSEAMLQQTQVATVIPYYHRFLSRFPTIQSLADADQQDVLRLWQGLGYYSRARNLQNAAKQIQSRFNGTVPDTVDDLLSLPGVGRYTAGAVASIAHNRRAPILDGNVARVLCRLDAIRSDPRDKPTNALLWSRAEEILPHKRLGDFNSALMELGATVCTPKNPQCLVCPVRENCQAQAAGIQDQIPPPRKARENPLERRMTLCIRCGDRWLIQQRPPAGRWAGMWQFLTVPAPDDLALHTDKSLPASVVRKLSDVPGTTSAQPLGLVTHGLTHRRYEFYVYRCDVPSVSSHPDDPWRRWVTFAELDQFPLPRPHLRIAEMLREL